MVSAFNNHFHEKTEILNALTKIVGVGPKMGIQALDSAGVTKNIAIGKLSLSQLSHLKSITQEAYDIDNELRFKTKSCISRLSSISCYRGLRHYLGLPCRGQRTHSNARTCRRLKRKTFMASAKAHKAPASPSAEKKLKRF